MNLIYMKRDEFNESDGFFNMYFYYDQPRTQDFCNRMRSHGVTEILFVMRWNAINPPGTARKSMKSMTQFI